jgi:hypothetical protein
MLSIESEKVRTRPELHAIPCPAPTKTWHPIPHGELADAIITRATDSGLVPTSEKWGVEDGRLYDGDQKIDIPGARLFGAINFQPPTGFPKGMAMSIAVKHANDKSDPFTILSGGEVFLCSNGVVTGEHVIRRKHTSGIDVEAIVELAFEKIIENTKNLAEATRRMQAMPLTTDRTELIAVKAARAGAYSSSQILKVVKEFEEPSFEEWGQEPRSLWRFYNSANHVIKNASMGGQITGLSKLSMVLFGLIGMSTKP